MLAKEKTIAFLATTNVNLSLIFYRDLLGLELSNEDDFALVFHLNEIELRIQKLKKLVPQPQTVLGWSVRSIEDAVGKLVSKGISFERFGGMNQNDLGIWDSPSGARIAWFKDPDGNMLSLTQHRHL